MNIEYIS